MKRMLLAVSLLVAGSAFAQTSSQYTVSDFTRQMPCTDSRGQVIATKLGTVCLPYAPTMVQGATLYELYSASADEWVFVSVSEPQANTPYVYRVNDDAQTVTFYGSGRYDRSLTKVAGSAAGHEGAFIGTYRSCVVNEPAYYLSGDKVCYTEQPLGGTQFRAYFTPAVMPVGQTLSDNVRLTFTTPAALRTMQQNGQQATSVVDRHNIGLQQGQYQMGGQKVQVK